MRFALAAMLPSIGPNENRDHGSQRQEITCARDRRSYLSDEQEILQSRFLGISLLRNHHRIARRESILRLLPSKTTRSPDH